MGFVLVRARHSMCPVMRPLPDDIAALVRSIAAKRPTRSVLVVSHHLDGLLRIQVSGLLHPETELGSLRFWSLAPTDSWPKPITCGELSSVLATRFTPSEEFPSSVAVPHHCGRCPLVVLSLHCRLEDIAAFPFDIFTCQQAAVAVASLAAEAA